MRLSRIAGIIGAMGVKWQKYNCTQAFNAYTTYAEGTWSSWVMAGISSSYTGKSSYTFNTSTGMYALTGSTVDLSSGNPGSAYIGGGVELTEGQRTGVDDFFIRKKSRTSNTIYVAYYTRGDYIGAVYAKNGAYPDAKKGYTYVTQFTSSGVAYTVMTDGNGNYYAYAQA